MYGDFCSENLHRKIEITVKVIGPTFDTVERKRENYMVSCQMYTVIRV